MVTSLYKNWAEGRLAAVGGRRSFVTALTASMGPGTVFMNRMGPVTSLASCDLEQCLWTAYVCWAKQGLALADGQVVASRTPLWAVFLQGRGWAQQLYVARATKS